MTIIHLWMSIKLIKRLFFLALETLFAFHYVSVLAA